MGDQIIINPDTPPRIEVRVIGTDVIDYVQLMKFDGRDWIVLFEAKPDAEECEFGFTDSGFTKRAIYYVWFKQKNIVENREVRGWSSPIWVFSS